MGDDLRQCFERDRCDRDCKPDCDCHDHHDDHCGSDWDFGGWIWIIVIIFLLCGGTNFFGGGFGGSGCKDDCCDSGFGGFGFWILIIIVIFWIFGSQKDDKCGGGFLGLF
ncbi:hypothetical protein [Sinanaerobacter chloroacetimidivorans]|uniref:hypothetical protein n=1 Tax=Sinanaerobacter chloroacetimidivorans TaxID=2818044 RepID=UPI001D041EA5|nr:hypothetical protein [Sinanaerobacter chloroacetimidivorans]